MMTFWACTRGLLRLEVTVRGCEAGAPATPPNMELPLSVVVATAGRFFWMTSPALCGETPVEASVTCCCSGAGCAM